MRTKKIRKKTFHIFLQNKKKSGNSKISNNPSLKYDSKLQHQIDDAPSFIAVSYNFVASIK